MLEKLGLPEKPSMRGAAWVIDASHCQGCSSQFTFINRKHHCRRCGGIFCNSCTYQRMVLRGQGDSPVRIRDPCKKLEDAARFELRYGHRNRFVKGNQKQDSEHDEEIVGQILGTDGNQPLLSGQESHASDLRKATSGASSSCSKESTTPNNAHNDIQSISPEELRKQAAEEKKRYSTLKGEGKPKEALQAFKRGRELERQAGTLEIALRKSRRMALKAPTGTQKKTDICEESGGRILPSRRDKEGEDELASELRVLGWSDADLHGTEKKPVNLTLEGELLSLLGEVPNKSHLGKGTGGIGNTQIIAHKKQALIFKREGKLAEAKEELKKAKILEKQQEEQELFAEAEDSDDDDELSSLIRSMDDDKQDRLHLGSVPQHGISFDSLSAADDDLPIDGGFDVTDDDMNDPELAAALKSFGWSEEEDEPSVDLEALKAEVLSLKRAALSKKRAGDSAEAMTLLKKAKLLEKDLESMQSKAQNFAPHVMPDVFEEPSVGRRGDEDDVSKINNLQVKMPPKNKLVIQKELLTLKKKALALRREGRIEEAEEELKKGKVLEQQLEEMENVTKNPVPKGGMKNLVPTHVHVGDSGALDLGEDGVEAEVTENDMHDPALLSILKNLGWNDDDNVEPTSTINKTSKQINHQSGHLVVPQRVRRSKAEIQKELLVLKRKALTLRRQGKTEEAEEVLERAKALENEMDEIEASHIVVSDEMGSHSFGSLIQKENSDDKKTDDDLTKAESYMTEGPLTRSSIPTPEAMLFESRPSGNQDVQFKESKAFVSVVPQSGQLLPMANSFTGSENRIQRPSIEEPPQREKSHKLETSSLRVSDKPGNQDVQFKESKSFVSAVPQSGQLLPMANSFTGSESRIQRPSIEESSQREKSHKLETSSLRVSDKPDTVLTVSNTSIMQEPGPTHEFDSEKAEVLARKRKAVQLKREGKLAEAREELRQAKLLEKCFEGSQGSLMGKISESTPSSGSSSLTQESSAVQARKPVSGRERFRLQQEALAHKRNALKLRKEGKIAESEAEFELAKVLESQLEEYGAQASSSNTGALDNVVVEDLLDPHLMSALKSIGLGDVDIAVQPSEEPQHKLELDKSRKSRAEKAQLEEEIKTEKARARNLHLAGKKTEALEALRSAKRLEKKLDLLTSY